MTIRHLAALSLLALLAACNRPGEAPVTAPAAEAEAAVALKAPAGSRRSEAGGSLSTSP